MSRAVLRCFLLVILCQGGAFGQQTRPREDVCLYSIHQMGYQSERFEQNVEDRLMELTKRVDELDLAQKRQIESSLQMCLNETQKRNDQNGKIYEILKEQQNHMESMLRVFVNRSREEQNMKDLVQVLREHLNPNNSQLERDQERLKTDFMNMKTKLESVQMTIDSMQDRITCLTSGFGSMKFPPQCCSFPFTYRGRNNYQCVNGQDGRLGCLIGNRTWVACGEPTDFVARNQTVNISLPFLDPFTTTSVHNWIVFQQQNYHVNYNFNRSWVEFKVGFGSLDGNFWLGLEKVHKMSNSAPYKLRLEFMHPNGSQYSAEYDSFRLGSEAGLYKIHVGRYSGDAGDIMHRSSPGGILHDGMNFSTYDRDNNLYSGGNLAASNQNGGWYNQNTNDHNNVFGVHLPVTGSDCVALTRMMMKKI